MAGILAHATVGTNLTQAEFEAEALHTFTWQDWTPTVTQSSQQSVTVTEAKYCRIGNLIDAQAVLVVTSSGTAGQYIAIGGWPVTIGNPAAAAIGSGYVYDASVGFYTATLRVVSGSVLGFIGYNVVDYIGVTPSFALANGDSIAFAVRYRTT